MQFPVYNEGGKRINCFGLVMFPCSRHGLVGGSLSNLSVALSRRPSVFPAPPRIEEQTILPDRFRHGSGQVQLNITA